MNHLILKFGFGILVFASGISFAGETKCSKTQRKLSCAKVKNATTKYICVEKKDYSKFKKTKNKFASMCKEKSDQKDSTKKTDG